METDSVLSDKRTEMSEPYGASIRAGDACF